MLYVRSALLSVSFFLTWLGFCVVCLPLGHVAAPPRGRRLKAWGHVSTALLRVLIGTRVEVRGAHRIPPGPLLVAAKHQSAFETFMLATLFDDPTLVLKAELARIPLLGFWVRALGLVALDRDKGARSLKRLVGDARHAFAQGRQLIIFPEGTRQAPGAPPDYKVGAAFVYDKCDVPCLPVALNSGVYWPRRSFLKYPGTIVVEILDPVPPGGGREAFRTGVQEAIEAASDRLLAEAAADPKAPPLRETARRRLAEMNGQGVNIHGTSVDSAGLRA